MSLDGLNWVRYREHNELADIATEARRVASLVGEEEYRRLLLAIGKGLNNKGYVTELDDLRFGLELQLLNVELMRSKRRLRAAVSQIVHEGTDFVLGAGQTINQVSEKARKELRGKIIGGLKTSGLRPLFHEFRVAARLANMGCEFCFNDLEVGGGPDFLVKRGGVVFELEAKSVTLFLGHPMQSQALDNLFLEIRSGFDSWHDRENYPVFTIHLSGGLPKGRDHHLAIVQALNELAATLDEHDFAETNWFKIQYDFMMSKREYVGVKKLATYFDTFSRGTVYMPLAHPRIIVRIRSERKDRFFSNLTTIISDAAKRQLSGERPSAVWVHIDYMSQSSFEFYSIPDSPQPLFSTIASAIFDSEKRRHVSQVIFSGAQYLDVNESRSRSSFRSVVFNSPYWQEPYLFDGGRERRKRRPDEIDLLRMIREHRSHL